MKWKTLGRPLSPPTIPSMGCHPSGFLLYLSKKNLMLYKRDAEIEAA